MIAFFYLFFPVLFSPLSAIAADELSCWETSARLSDDEIVRHIDEYEDLIVDPRSRITPAQQVEEAVMRRAGGTPVPTSTLRTRPTVRGGR